MNLTILSKTSGGLGAIPHVREPTSSARPREEPKPRPRIAVIAAGSPLKRSTWSGIPFNIHRELRRRYGDVHAIENPILDYVLQRITHPRRIRWFLPRTPLLTRIAAAFVEYALWRLKPDLVVCINATHKVVDLTQPWPLVLVEDAPFDTITAYYGRFDRLWRKSWERGHLVEQATIDRCRSVLLASEWAREEAVRTLDFSRSSLSVAPLGANLDVDPAPVPLRQVGGELRLLFVGYDWVRKGGPLVLETLAELKRRGVRVSLHIVGCRPAAARGVDGVVLHGRLRKQAPEDAALLEELYRSSSLFFMPTRQEAYGLVYCEACAFGLPILATRTGGVPEIVQSGDNGVLLPLAAKAQDYANAIETLWADGALYRTMQVKARQAYLDRLNWRSWGDAFDDAVNPVGTPARAG